MFLILSTTTLDDLAVEVDASGTAYFREHSFLNNGRLSSSWMQERRWGFWRELFRPYHKRKAAYDLVEQHSLHACELRTAMVLSFTESSLTGKSPAIFDVRLNRAGMYVGMNASTNPVHTISDVDR